MPVDPAQLQVLHDEEKQEFYIDLKGKRWFKTISELSSPAALFVF